MGALRTLLPLPVHAVLATSTASHSAERSGSLSAPENVVDLDPSTLWASEKRLCTNSSCWENVTLDFGAVRSVGALRVRVGFRYEGGYGNAEVMENELAWSIDARSWYTISRISGGPSQTQTRHGFEADATSGGGAVQARYVRFSQRKRDEPNPKFVLAHDFHAWGVGGPFGALSTLPTNSLPATSLRDMLGVNSI